MLLFILKSIERYHASVNCQPSLVLVLFHYTLEKLRIDWVTHLLMYPALVAGHVVGDNGHAQSVCRVHPIHVDIHYDKHQSVRDGRADHLEAVFSYAARRASEAKSHFLRCPYC